MRHLKISVAVIAALLSVSNLALAQSVEDCRARAQRASDNTSGSLAGAARGAVGGAVIGGLLGRSTGAKRGAALGGIVKGVQTKDNKQEAYNEEFERCMRERESR
jgi:outer membrane lipoprotein SlyB